MPVHLGDSSDHPKRATPGKDYEIIAQYDTGNNIHMIYRNDPSSGRIQKHKEDVQGILKAFE